MRIYEINGDRPLNFFSKILLLIQIFFDILKEKKINFNYKNQIILKTKNNNFSQIQTFDKKIISPMRIASLDFLINYFKH